MNLSGKCACDLVIYQLNDQPMFTHCCHCTSCQRETGSAFVINALIETENVQVLRGLPEMVETPSESGKGQVFARCPSCRIALWSHYAGAGDKIAFVRVGTLENPNDIHPNIHIFTRSKLAWVNIPDDVPARSGYYNRNKYWPAASLKRHAKL